MRDPGFDRLRRWVRLSDSAFRIPGTSITFGLDPIVGLVPGIGDLASPLLTLMILWRGARMRVPKIVLARMVFNALIDAGVGAIPVVGDLFDFAWKATEWNLGLLERHALPGTPPRTSDWVFVGVCVAVLVLAAVVPILVFWIAMVWLGAKLHSLG